jgi:hypothetical protein
MLSNTEISKIKHAIETHDLSDEDYELLDDIIYEYCQYRRCGSPEDCEQRKEWMEMSYEDIRKSFNETLDALRSEVRNIRRESQITKRVVKKSYKSRK